MATPLTGVSVAEALVGIEQRLEEEGWLRLLRRLRRAWRDTSPALRWFLVVMWLIGAVLLVLGWVADSHGFWSDRPFLTNLASSVIAAIFGIPFVLVVLQQIVTAQTERSDARAAQRLAARVSREMLNAAWKMVQGSPGVMKALIEFAA